MAMMFFPLLELLFVFEFLGWCMHQFMLFVAWISKSLSDLNVHEQLAARNESRFTELIIYSSQHKVGYACSTEQSTLDCLRYEHLSIHFLRF